MNTFRILTMGLTLALLPAGAAWGRGGASRAPGSFTLTAPANGATNQPLNVTLSWSASRRVTSYTVQVDTEIGFGAPLVYSGSTTGTNLAVALAGGTSYYWRVIAVSGALTTTASNAPFRFTTGSAPPPPPSGSGWARTYGGVMRESTDASGGDAMPTTIRPMTGGGYRMVSSTSSFGFGSSDLWVVRLSDSGAVLSQKAVGTTGADYAYAFEQTADGGCWISGTLNGLMCLIRLSSDDSIVVQKTYHLPGSMNWYLRKFRTTPDGGAVLAGSINSDAFLLRVDSGGNPVLQRQYRGLLDEHFEDVIVTADGGYAAVGYVSLPINSAINCSMVRLSADGSILWKKAYASSDGRNGMLTSIQAMPDGGYVAAGNAGLKGATVIRLSADGSVLWQNGYGHLKASSIERTPDGGFVFLSAPRDSFNNDIMVEKIASDGTSQWKNLYGGASQELGHSILPTADGGYIASGLTGSYGLGYYDGWVLKLSSNGACGSLARPLSPMTSPAGLIPAVPSLTPIAIVLSVVPSTAGVMETQCGITSQAP